MQLENSYFDRDLSWLSFNERVLEESGNQTLPLYERIKFLAIYSSNLDEFFRVRVANLRRLIRIDKKKINKRLPYEPVDLFIEIQEKVNLQLRKYGQSFRQILEELKEEKIIVCFNSTVSVRQQEFLRKTFRSKILPFLQPVFIGQAKSKNLFLENRALYLIVELQKSGHSGEETVYVQVNIPSQQVDRFIALPQQNDHYYFITIDDVIRENLDWLFPGYQVTGSYSIKLNRDAELNIDDEYSGDLVDKIRKQIEKRKIGVPSRFLYDEAMPAEMLSFLVSSFGLDPEDLVGGGRYHNLNDLLHLPNPYQPGLSHPRFESLDIPALENSDSIFDAIRTMDQAIHYPYQNYDYVIRFFSEAAIDPAVKEIRVTLYRVASASLIVNALISAARNGKKVMVFVEVKARFDEENNLYWASRMEEAGIKIIYSIPGLKVHAKIALIRRKTTAGNNEYFAYLGTGNFNESTARFYADHGLFTASPVITSELNGIFRFLYKKKAIPELKELMVAPFNLVDRLQELIDQEINAVKNGKKGYLIIKLNNLEDSAMIDKLYEASRNGVKIDLLVRGICCLIPGKEDLSENISVYRLLDRFLEHARIFYFYNQGRPLVFLGSADWMQRNLYRRLEVCFPVHEQEIKKDLIRLLELQLKDNTNLRKLDNLGNQPPVERKSRARKINAQHDFYNYLFNRTKPEIS